MKVHLELPAPEALEALTALVRENMEGVAQLSVPLVVDLGEGKNWREAH